MALDSISTRNKTLIVTLISFSFYFFWALWVNSLVSNDQELVLRSAIIQGSYSALMTVSFTTILTWTLAQMKCHNMPYLAIIPPLIMQSSLVYFVNLLNQTPNLLATITPSILFTALYGLFYSRSLLKTAEYKCSQ